jgi:hypothetical protein
MLSNRSDTTSEDVGRDICKKERMYNFRLLCGLVETFTVLEDYVMKVGS